MRRVLGGVVLIAGVGGLGWVASNTHAVRMEEAVAAAAGNLTADSRHGLTATVSGRDVTVTGISEQAELDALTAQFDAIEGRRIVNFDGVQVLPVVDPFELTFDGENLAGVIPLEADRDVLRGVAGDSAENLTLADGEPDGQWGQVAAGGIAALETLKTGSLRLTGQELVVSGIAATPEDLAAFDAAIGTIPSDYTLVSDIEVEDDGTPMRLDLAYDGTDLTGTGKLPVDLQASTLLGEASSSATLEQAKIAASDPEWDVVAQEGVNALLATENGSFTLQDRMARLSGQILPENQATVDAAVQAMRDAAPEYDITTAIEPYDDGAPFSLQATFDGDLLSAAGKVPADFGDGLDANLLATKTTSEIATAFITDDSGTWPDVAHAGLNALATLEEGTLDITGDTITLNGMSRSPAAFETTKAALGNFANAGEVSFLDDGSPIAMALTYNGDTATVSGKLPADLTPTDISEALGIEVTDDGTTQSVLTSEADLLAPLLSISDALPEVDNLTFTNGANGAQFDAVAAPGVDAAQLNALLAEKLGETASVAVADATELPTQGSTRTNRFTGRTEVFSSGYWLPRFDFRSTEAACAEQSDALLEESKVRFLSGSAELDVQSIRAINGLSALVRKCALEAGLFLTVSGHTDNTGDPDANLALSQARADAVRDAILARGVTQSAVTAQGFGDTQPIADNDTEEGKAANRRTAFSWVFE